MYVKDRYACVTGSGRGAFPATWPHRERRSPELTRFVRPMWSLSRRSRDGLAATLTGSVRACRLTSLRSAHRFRRAHGPLSPESRMAAHSLTPPLPRRREGLTRSGPWLQPAPLIRSRYLCRATGWLPIGIRRRRGCQSLPPGHGASILGLTGDRGVGPPEPP